MRRNFLFAAAILVAALQFISSGQTPQPFSPYVDAEGRISRPTEYRKHWVHLGTYFVQGATAEGNSMHSVYTERHSLDAYQSTGAWPDGTTLVKEVMSTAGSELTTGDANWAAQPQVWFVVIKDTQGRFSENPLWGDGWGWALFEAARPDVQTATDYREDCLACHEPARETDLVYVQGYPVLGMLRETKRSAVNATAEEEVDFASGSAERGALVFAGTCTLCHTLAAGVRKRGPSLGGIAESARLPSGKPASPQNILRQVNEGGGGMPALAARLSAEQKADVIAYLKTPR